MTDFLTVKAKRTFAVGVGLKTRHSPEFEIEAGEARLLVAQGLVEIVGSEDVEGDVFETDSTKPNRKSRKG